MEYIHVVKNLDMTALYLIRIFLLDGDGVYIYSIKLMAKFHNILLLL